MSFLPILERAFFYLAIMKERPSSNLLFFADIARHTPTDYRAKIAAAYDADSESMTVFTADLADQVVRVSRIGVRKFWMFNIAAIPLLIALIAAAVLMVFPRS